MFAPDLRGHGATSTDGEDLDAATLVDDLAALWAAAPIVAEQPPVVLVGHSMGGALAVRAAGTKKSMMIVFTCISRAFEQQL